jgi:hypothetical protein
MRTQPSACGAADNPKRVPLLIIRNVPRNPAVTLNQSNSKGDPRGVSLELQRALTPAAQAATLLPARADELPTVAPPPRRSQQPGSAGAFHPSCTPSLQIKPLLRPRVATICLHKVLSPTLAPRFNFQFAGAKNICPAPTAPDCLDSNRPSSSSHSFARPRLNARTPEIIPNLSPASCADIETPPKHPVLFTPISQTDKIHKHKHTVTSTIQSNFQHSRPAKFPSTEFFYSSMSA